MSLDVNVSPDDSSKLGVPIIIGFALIMVSFWMFVWRSSFEGVFHFDDYRNIIDNEQIRQVWPLNRFSGSNRPIGLYSFALNFHFSETDPFAYHVVNLTIHVLNGLLVFSACLFTWRLYRRHWCDDEMASLTYSVLLTSGLIATAWVVHPLTTQAVTNIVQRYESLASLGYLGVWVGLMAYLFGYRLLGCLIILPLAWIGLMSKEIFATAPLAVLLFDRLITKNTWVLIAKARWLPYILMLSPYVWFLPSVLRWLNPSRPAGSSMGVGLKSVTSWEYLRTQPEIIWNYLYLTVWPEQLCFDYVWRIQDKTWIYLPLGLSILGILFAAGFMYWRGAVQRTSFPLGLVGWLTLTFFIILAPTSSFVPIADLAVEHRMYLVSAIVVALLTLIAAAVARKILANSKQPNLLHAGFACIALVCIGMLAWRTHLRNLDYRDGLLLWQSAAEASPENPRAWYNVGRELILRGDPDAALQPMAKAVGYSNTSVPIHDAGLAYCLNHIGRTEDAITLYERALSRKPDYEEALVGLGECLTQLGRGEEAIKQYERALSENPGSKEALNDLGVIYLDRAPAKARQYFSNAAELGSHEAIYNLGWLDLKQGEVELSMWRFEQALKVQPDFHPAALRLAWILATSDQQALRDVALARRLLDEHYDLSTTSAASALDTDGAIRAAMGDFVGAIQSTENALEIVRGREKPDESYIAELEQRISTYRDGRHWLGGNQP